MSNQRMSSLLFLTYFLRMFSVAQSKYWGFDVNIDQVEGRVAEDFGCLTGMKIPTKLREIAYCDDGCQSRERELLMNFHRTTNFEIWSQDVTFGVKELHHCEWEGVICLRNNKHVIAVDIPNRQIRGECVTYLRHLLYLLALCLRGNECNDSFTRIGEEYNPHLLAIDLRGNMVRGTISSELHLKWPSLKSLNIRGTEIKGALPSDLSNLANLEVLNLGCTKVASSSVLGVVAKMKNLRYLNLEGMNILGNLSSLANLSGLRHLDLSQNNFNGCIPIEFGSWFPHMTTLILSNNALSCTLPFSFGQMKKLEILRLKSNSAIEGLIPYSFGSIPGLKLLDISETSLRGFENDFIFSSLTSFIARDCTKFTATLNSLIKVLSGSRKTLRYLQIRNSNLNGKMWRLSFTYFPTLTVLDLSGNKMLTGGISRPEDKNSNLLRIDLSYCNLDKPLPLSHLRKLTDLTSINVVGNKKMRGPLLISYLAFNYQYMSNGNNHANYECPEVFLRNTECELHVDPAYFGRQHCICRDGFYGSSGLCMPCMQGGHCYTDTSEFNDSLPHFPVMSVMKVEAGYQPTPELSTVQYLRKCQDSVSLSYGRKTDFVCFVKGKIQTSNSSQGFTYCKRKVTCYHGYEGESCIRCKQKFYELNNRCRPCGEGNMVWGAVTVTVFFMCAIVTLWIWKGHDFIPLLILTLELTASIFLSLFKIIPGWIAEIYLAMSILSFCGRGMTSKGILKICVVFLQLAGALFLRPTGPFDGPRVLNYIQQIFNFQVGNFECIFTIRLSITGKYLLNVTFPILICLLIWLGFGFLDMIGRLRGTNIVKDKGIDKYVCRLSIVIFNLSYFPIVKRTLYLVNSCSLDVHDPCSSYERESSCPIKEATNLVFLASCTIILYALGVPAVFATLLFKYRKQINDDNEKISAWLGPLYLSYRHESRFGMYMEILMILRRLLIAVLLVFMNTRVTLQSFLLSLIFLVSLLVETRLKPFKIMHFWQEKDIKQSKRGTFGIENVVELAGLSILLLGVVWIRMPMLTSHLNLKDLLWIEEIILSMALLLAIICCIVIFRRFCPLRRKTGEETSLLSLTSFSLSRIYERL